MRRRVASQIDAGNQLQHPHFKLGFRDPVEVMIAHTTTTGRCTAVSRLLSAAGTGLLQPAGVSPRADGTYVKVRGEWVYQRVDRAGDTVDISAQSRRDVAPAKAFFRMAIKGQRSSRKQSVTPIIALASSGGATE
jgi:DDE domain